MTTYIKKIIKLLSISSFIFSSLTILNASENAKRQKDDHAYTKEKAILLENLQKGKIEKAGDEDYFKIEMQNSGLLKVFTTGSSDTYGYLYNSSGERITTNDDEESGIRGSNFSISKELRAGIYYVKVCLYHTTETGDYTVYKKVYPLGSHKSSDTSLENAGSVSNGEFQVNSEIESYQNDPSITPLNNGGFVITWVSYDKDGENTFDDDKNHIAAQIFNKDGEKTGSEFQVNSEIEGNQLQPSVTTLKNGNFVIVWTSSDSNADNFSDDNRHVSAQIFNENGDTIGSEFQVNSEIGFTQSEPSASALSNGGFVVTWVSDDNKAKGFNDKNRHISAQIFDKDGKKLGGEFQVNSEVQGQQNEPSVSSLSNGTFIITWKSNDKNGKRISDKDNYHIAAQIFNKDGKKIGEEFQVNSITKGYQNEPSIATLSDNKFVISWVSYDSKSNGTKISAQIFSKNGKKLGREFQVNSENEGYQIQPSITPLNNGGFIVTWTSDDKKGKNFTDKNRHISAQIFNKNGGKVGSEFQINVESDSKQFKPSAATLRDGRFIITWVSNDKSAESISDNNSYHIAAKIFDKNKGTKK